MQASHTERTRGSPAGRDACADSYCVMCQRKRICHAPLSWPVDPMVGQGTHLADPTSRLLAVTAGNERSS